MLVMRTLWQMQSVCLPRDVGREPHRANRIAFALVRDRARRRDGYGRRRKASCRYSLGGRVLRHPAAPTKPEDQHHNSPAPRSRCRMPSLRLDTPYSQLAHCG